MTVDRLAQICAAIGPLDAAAMAAARARQDTLTKPPGALGRLEELSIWLAGVRAEPIARIDTKVIITAAADHGVAQQGVSAYPREVTGQMVLNFLAGGAAVNVLARQAGATVLVVDAGVDAELPDHPALLRRSAGRGTNDFTLGPAMTREQALTCVLAGAELAAEQIAAGADVLAAGEMGIGNTTSAAALTAAVTGLPPAAVTGRGTGIADDRLEHKIAVVEAALTMHTPDPADGIGLLSAVGGFEIAFLTGVILGAAAGRRPAVIDGFISGAAGLIACVLAPAARDYLLASHRSAELGHRLLLDYLDKPPLLDLDMRLGEGTGAALAIQILEASARILSDMATFESAGVSGSDEAHPSEG